MMNKADYQKLSPSTLWGYFYDLTQIPRPTGHCQAVREYVVAEGKRLGLETHVDEVGNVLIRKPATPGLENRPVATLQGHLDMVPQKNSDKVHNFETDPIQTLQEGDWITADGTTLGADNGMGVAFSLAVLADDTLKHGPIEALFTIDEEVGMDGANGLKPGFSKGDILLNIDSEVEGDLFVGCAGGVDVNVSLEYQDNHHPDDDEIGVRLTIKGLKGGHSGVDIHLGRANANKLMARLLKDAVAQCGALVSEIDGGNMRNAIPREAVALLSVKEEDTEALWELVSDYEELFNKEFAGIENHITVSLERCDRPETILPDEIQDALIHALNACPNGVISMLSEFPDTVESSSNMAQVKAGKGCISVRVLVRSSSDSRKMWVASSIESCFLLMDARVEFDASYTGWQPNAESHIMQVMCQAAKEVYGKDPAVKVMHAGLECGIIQGVMPDMDMISFGPEIQHPHSPDERVSISSVERSYRMLVRALELI